MRVVSQSHNYSVDFDRTVFWTQSNLIYAKSGNENIVFGKYESDKQNAVDKYTRMTQADRIRSMSDEELADYIFGVSVHEKPCVLCSDDCDFCELTDEECKNRTLKWLQSEVEE